jgi:hypothetical protein
MKPAYVTVVKKMIQNPIFLAQHKYYNSLAGPSTNLLEKELLDFLLERIKECEEWWEGFEEMEPRIHHKCIIWNTCCYISASQNKYFWRMADPA